MTKSVKKAAKAESNTIENAISDSNEETAEIANIGIRTMQKFANYEAVTPAALQDMGSELMAGYRNFFSTWVEVSQEALACRTASDVVKLQSKVMKHSIDAYIIEATRLNNLMMEGCTKAMEPLHLGMAASSDRLYQMLATK
jgi:hypothetical protein